MLAEVKPAKSPVLLVEKEKLDHLWETAWQFLEKTIDHPTDDRQLIFIMDMLVEIQSHWDSDFLDKIDIRSWSTSGGYPYVKLEKEAGLHVWHPGSLGTRDGSGKESFDFEGNVSDEWVEIVQSGLDFLLKH